VTDLGERLTADLTFLALCWRLARPDGVTLGFTTHDEPLAIAGLSYAPAPGIAPSAIVQSDGLDIDTMEIDGALSSGAITAADLLAGRWDGAVVSLFLADWRSPEAGRLALADGTLGAVTAGEGDDPPFTATLLGPTAALDAVLVETCSPECRAELSDWRCRVPMRGRRRRGVVATASDAGLTVAGLSDASPYAQGRLRAVDGDAAGIETRIAAAAGATLHTDDRLALAPGDLVELTEGCDKLFATCRDRFGNALNFRGEPHVPGNDLLTRFAV
jgi:uncharacterized phage protein (TIGR02218 family)